MDALFWMHRGYDMAAWMHTTVVASSFGGGDPLKLHPYEADIRADLAKQRAQEETSREDVRAFLRGATRQ